MKRICTVVLLLVTIVILNAEVFLQQSFEESASDTWAYTANPAGETRSIWWGRSDQVMGGATAQNGSWYWGSWDLDNVESSLSFPAVTLPVGYTYSLSLYYFTNGLISPSEYSKYSVAYNTGSDWTTWITLTPDTDAWTQVSLNIPSYATQFRLKVAASHNGSGKYAHWDAFTINRIPAEPSAPIISNTTVAQRNDGSGLVDVYYDLSDANGDASTISVLLSENGGTSFSITPSASNLSGDIGVGISIGTAKHIVWNAAAEAVDFDNNQYKLRVLAEDNTHPTIATPVFSPPAGTYQTAQNVQITCATVGATIRYTTNGANPTLGSPIYTTPIAIALNTTMTIKAKAFKTGWTDSAIASALYSVTGTVATPTFNPVAGTYQTAQSVTINCATAGATIYYTLNGTDPTTSSSLFNPVYPILIPLNTSVQLKARAFKTNWISSVIASGSYVITGTVATPTFNPVAGTYQTAQSVTISCATSGATIRYTINGTDPTSGSMIYSTPIPIALGTTMTLKAKAFKTNWTDSAIATALFTILQPVETPIFSVLGGEYQSFQSVQITCPTTGATIRYTTDNSDPTESSLLYQNPVSITQSTNLKAKAFKTAWAPSATATVAYTISNFVLVAGGTFNNSFGNVTISPLYMDKYELTQPAYQAVMGTNPANFQSVMFGPVEQVNWFNAIEYCNRRSITEGYTPCYSYSTYGTNPSSWPVGWNTSYANHMNVSCDWVANGYRLPSEMEWMFAAKGGNLSQGYTYSGSNTIATVAWYVSNSGNTSHTVGTKTANELGLFDMSGNVWEWVWDIYGYPIPTGVNPHGNTTGNYRAVRAGGWADAPSACTVSYHDDYQATYDNYYIGFRICRLPEEFVLVPGGTYYNGVSDVTVSSVYLSRTEVSQTSYQAIMGDNPSNFTSVVGAPVEQVSWFKAIEYCNKRSISEGLTPAYSYSTYGTNPVNWPAGWSTNDANHTNVSCNWTANGYRLPTEAEWEFAAMGGNLSHEYLYSGSNTINDVAWYTTNSGNTTHTVGTKAANELGLFDMSGNTWEFCWDIVGDFPSGAQTNPHGPSTGTERITKGGSYPNPESWCEVGTRAGYTPTGLTSQVGFRVCRNAP
jgi:formylglycine-generating enzyme required for sulfatase activity